MNQLWLAPVTLRPPVAIDMPKVPSALLRRFTATLVKTVSALNVISNVLKGGVPLVAVQYSPISLLVLKLLITEKLRSNVPV
jgi:hypothetical protein